MVSKPEVREEVVRRTAALCRDRGIVIPTFAQMRDPTKSPTTIRDRLLRTGLSDIDPVNLM